MQWEYGCLPYDELTVMSGIGGEDFAYRKVLLRSPFK